MNDNESDFVAVHVELSNGKSLTRNEVTSLRTLSLQNANAVSIRAPELGRFWQLKTLKVFLITNEHSDRGAVGAVGADL